MRDDKALLLDMLLACRKIQIYTAEMNIDQFRLSDMAQSAVLREIQVIGEAAHLVTTDTKAQHSDIPWTQIAGMRNRIIHEYFNVDIELLWNTIQHHIPPLMTALENTLTT